MIRFNNYLGVLVLVAIVGGIALFVPEALALRTVALDPWFPTGYVGDVLVWLLLVVDFLAVGYTAYRLGSKLQLQPH